MGVNAISNEVIPEIKRREVFFLYPHLEDQNQRGLRMGFLNGG